MKKKEMYQHFMKVTIAPHVAAVEKQLKKNNTGYLVGNEVTYKFFLPTSDSLIIIMDQ